ncbi:MAG TPA: amidohydrolase family protein [Dehalococcoidia bacterium]|nr:amidohydrolase family protein [Dehalococcoidia bacterium]
MPEPSDLVLRRCRRLDEAGLVDIAVRDGHVECIGRGLSGGRQEVDLGGAFVSAAWVDCHAHVASEVTPGRIDPLTYGPAQGVGALIDAGSAPPRRMGELLATRPWVYALANVDSRGIRGEGLQPEISGAAADEALGRYPGRVVGLKVQASQSVLGELAPKAIENAIKVAERHGVPVMVHVGNPPPALEVVCDLLRAGDVITHYAHGKPEGATLADGRPLPALRRAYERGVLLDVGHGRSSFSFRRFRQLLEAGIRPSTISTDLHASSARSPVVSLARTMSKLIELGLPPVEALDKVTAAPARAFALQGYGELKEGGPASLTAFVLEEREVMTEDSLGEMLACKLWVRPIGCLAGGEWFEATTPP